MLIKKPAPVVAAINCLARLPKLLCLHCGRKDKLFIREL